VGIFLQTNASKIVLDMGSGVLGRIAEAGIDWQEIDAVFISHFHPDHCLDLFAYLFALRNPSYPRSRPLYLFGPKGLKSLVEDMNKIFSGWFSPRGYELVIDELFCSGSQSFSFQDLKVISYPVNHSPESLAYRIEAEGKVIAYSGDTAPCKELIELAKGADLAIFECSWAKEQKPAEHLTARQAGEIAQMAGAKKLALVHFYPEALATDPQKEAEKEFKGEVIIASDLLRISL